MLVEAGVFRTTRFLVMVHTAAEQEEVAYYRSGGWRVAKLWLGGLKSLRRRILLASEDSEEEIHDNP